MSVDKRRLERRDIVASLGGQAEHSIVTHVRRSDVTLPQSPDFTVANFVCHLVALDRLTRTTEPTKMLLGTDPFLDGTVILRQDVVQILNRPMTTPA
jgi:hypothetical protein